MEIAEHINALRREGEWLADAAERAGLDATVPPCVPWQVKDLLRHTGYVHRWAARHITECPDQIIDGPSEEEILRGGADDARLLAWFRDGHAALAQTLATADPAVACATFMPAPSPLAFWARRQAHETAIHRADADSAAGTMPEYEADFAADGIDELIMGFGRRRKYQPTADGGTRLSVLATDTGDAWLVEAHDSRVLPRRDAGGQEEAGCTVSGPASGLYLYLWNRADAARADVTVIGDRGLLSAWQSSVRVRWG
ncbi:MAG TPA: maleylpyruvate isomerase family mycothiol-dependent enzyme [Streptosporangiaceae bacterium]|nr:maleylpyruvate isomerase family mycothiol-dependent enzyme [Streptosporangiaceae bacterium]